MTHHSGSFGSLDIWCLAFFLHGGGVSRTQHVFHLRDRFLWLNSWLAVPCVVPKLSCVAISTWSHQSIVSRMSSFHHQLISCFFFWSANFVLSETLLYPPFFSCGFVLRELCHHVLWFDFFGQKFAQHKKHPIILYVNVINLIFVLNPEIVYDNWTALSCFFSSLSKSIIFSKACQQSTTKCPPRCEPTRTHFIRPRRRIKWVRKFYTVFPFSHHNQIKIRLRIEVWKLKHNCTIIFRLL